METYQKILNVDDFLNKKLSEKAAILNRSMAADPKAVVHFARNWMNRFRMEAAIAQFFLAKSLATAYGQPYAEKEAKRCIALAEGLNDKDEFSNDGNTIQLPGSFAALFPQLMEFAFQYWETARNSDKQINPVFVLHSKETEFSVRTVLRENLSEINHWPISFDRKILGEDGEGREQSLTREEIASTVIRQCMENGVSLPRMKRKSAKVVTLGSCFATNLSNALTAKGIASTTLRIEEAINTTAANRLFLDHCLNGVGCPELEIVINGRDISGLKDLLLDADLIVLTVGVAPIVEWVDTGKLCIADKYRPLLEEKRIRQRFTTVEENRQNIAYMVNMLRSHNPKVNICVTLSPVPLLAAVDGRSPIERDALSKSILKLSIEEARKDSNFFYWPSFEAVKWVAPHIAPEANYLAYGAEDKNSRHASRWLIDVIVQEFMNAVFVD